MAPSVAIAVPSPSRGQKQRLGQARRPLLSGHDARTGSGRYKQLNIRQRMLMQSLVHRPAVPAPRDAHRRPPTAFLPTIAHPVNRKSPSHLKRGARCARIAWTFNMRPGQAFSSHSLLTARRSVCLASLCSVGLLTTLLLRFFAGGRSARVRLGSGQALTGRRLISRLITPNWQDCMC